MKAITALSHGSELDSPPDLGRPQLILTFGAVDRLQPVVSELVGRYPTAIVASTSTAGEILGERVLEGAVVSVGVEFDDTTVRGACAPISSLGSLESGRRLAESLRGERLAHVLLFSDGLDVNGSELVRGLSRGLGVGVSVSGGLAGDGDAFRETKVGLGTRVAPGQVVAVGLYGNRLRVGCGWGGGWDVFGPDRVVSRSEGNVLFELDGEPALDLYELYLGAQARDLPASALLFPLSLRDAGMDGVVRTVLGIDRERKALIFAGDLPVGSVVRLMNSNVDRLVGGAARAATRAAEGGGGAPSLALLVSCVGRKLVMRQRIEEELDAVIEALPTASVCGFYSYGEIAPFDDGIACALHNQTMTVTTLGEMG